ncbi:hypothetical protein O181_060964 [Austropuccinia psidii MF-1]|uniref:Myb-like domain-containing protein n=1 Tax=Austropuccinia psidii MF-1 TaxID=1389203 RepID=A0A9Q3EH84_9BASI|nr:hypothetical protein [Austropuccinia psidii MF-1]
MSSSNSKLSTFSIRRQRSNTTPNQSLNHSNHDNNHYEKQLVNSTTNNSTNLSTSSSSTPSKSPISQLRKKFSKPNLKRQANSPVYHDDQTIILPSLTSGSNRRVAQCVPNRIRNLKSDLTSISNNHFNLSIKSNHHHHHHHHHHHPQQQPSSQQQQQQQVNQLSNLNQSNHHNDIINSKIENDSDQSIKNFNDLQQINPIINNNNNNQIEPQSPNINTTNNINNSKDRKRKNNGIRNKWTKEETAALVRGCNKFAIGQWKAIRDSEPLLAKRSPGDLKDRFRTYFPDAYRQHYPNAKTHISSRVRSVDSEGNPIFGENAVRKERKQFSQEEDEALKRGYIKFGTAWTSIQRDPILASRKATDLRDRFRNAFPDLYAAAGYKPRPRKSSSPNLYGFLLDPPQHRETFEAIDLSLYPNYPSRGLTHIRPDQYQLPSLDFLKAHGAEAFSDFRMILSNDPQTKSVIEGPNLWNTEDHELTRDELWISPSIPSHNLPTSTTSNLTPSLTPRPNDTTPRPPKPSTTLGSQFQSIEPNRENLRSSRPLHKAQSSMDLTQFSNLHLVDNNHYLNSITFNHPLGLDLYSHPDFLHTIDYPYPSTSIPFVPHPNHDHSSSSLFNSSNSTLSLNSNIHQSIEQTDLSGIESSPLNSTSTDWLNDLSIASQTFPNAFDLNEFTHCLMSNQDAASSVSSLISSDHSVEIADDKVIYTGNRLNQSGSSQNLIPPSGLSPKLLDLSNNSNDFNHDLKANDHSDSAMKMMMMMMSNSSTSQLIANLSPSPSPSSSSLSLSSSLSSCSSNIPNHHTRSLEATLCPAALSDQLLVAQNSNDDFILDEEPIRPF